MNSVCCPRTVTVAPRSKFEFTQTWQKFLGRFFPPSIIVKELLWGGRGLRFLQVWEELRNIIGNKTEWNPPLACEREPTSISYFLPKQIICVSVVVIITVLAIKSRIQSSETCRLVANYLLIFWWWRQYFLPKGHHILPMHMTSYSRSNFHLIQYHVSALNITFRDSTEDCARKLYILI